MSRRAWVAAAFVLLVPGYASAQQDTEWVLLQSRIDSLMPFYEAAGRAWMHVDSIRVAQKLDAEREPLDSARLGPFLIVTQRSLTKRLLPVFRNAYVERAAMFAGVADSVRITLLAEGEEQYLAFQFMAKAPRHHVVTVLPADADTERRIALNAFDDAMLGLAPPAVRAWLMDARPSSARDARRSYRLLATAQANIAKRCFRNEPGACAQALALAGTIDSLGGYTPEQIRALVVRSHARTDERIRGECLRDNDMAKCLRVLSVYGGAPTPLHQQLRASLFAYALHRGGEGAAARLHESRGVTVGEALSATAGMDAGPLASEWRAALDHELRPSWAGIGKTGATTVIWSLVSLALALRSTRRRAA